MVTHNSHDLAIHDKDISVLKQPVHTSYRRNLRAPARLPRCYMDGAEEELEPTFDTTYVLLHAPHILRASLRAKFMDVGLYNSIKHLLQPALKTVFFPVDKGYATLREGHVVDDVL